MRRLGWLGFVLCASGCAGVPPPPAQSVASPPPAAPLASPAVAATSAALAARTLARSAVHAALLEGLGMFLQRVDLDTQPALEGGKFHGFRIAALHDPAFWRGVDLKPGDVVTAVNGFPIERPEQAESAFESLEVASELRVAFERDGQKRELVYTIVDR